MSTINVFFLGLLILIVGIAIGATCHWAISLAAKVEAWDAKEATKIKAAAERDIAVVEAATKGALGGLSALWSKVQADADAIIAAKQAAAASASVAPASSNSAVITAPPPTS
jgi:hypothetical protein